MQAFCDKIYKWCTEIVSFAPGDNNNVDKIPTSQAGVESVLMNGDAINAINWAQTVNVNGESVNSGVSIYKWWSLFNFRHKDLGMDYR